MTTWRKVPATVMTLVSERPLRGAVRPIISRHFVPASARVPGDYCIVPTMGVLVLTADNGKKVHYGMDGARITADLEMVVKRNEWTADPESCRDEVLRKQWPIVQAD